MPRFVVLEHRLPPTNPRGLHWDLMLECGVTLRTWALESQPWPGESIAAEALADHRLEYLDYEGPVSGDRGEVTRWDGGTYHVQQESVTHLTLQFAGSKLRGIWTLKRDNQNAQRWTFTCGTT